MKRLPLPFLRLLLFTALVLTPAALLHAENWPHWRGPNFDGSTQAKNPPTEFSKKKNVRWSADLPGPSAATPIIWEDKIFVSSTHLGRQQLLAMCLNRRDGSILWQHEIAVGISQDNRSNYASPSPTTDGERVFFFYGNGNLYAFDMDGKKIWNRNLQKDYGEFAFLWTFSSSPLLYKDTLYMQILQRDEPVNGRGDDRDENPSFLLALNPATGKELWKTERPSKAVAESREAFSSPIPYTHQGREMILVAGGDAMTAHNPEDGQEIWRWGTWNPQRISHWRLVPSPVAANGIALACGPKGSPVYAVKAGQTGTLDDSDLAWASKDREVSSDVSTPLFYKNHFYILNSDRKTLSAVEPASGKVLWSEEIGSRSKIESSPTAAGGNIYFMNFQGEVFVAAAGDEFKILHKAEMGEPADNDLRSSIAITDGELFIRTGSKLYCIAANPAVATP